ncbi:hypothetical protein MAPG_02946 [Magnaporthiopsis poae ATCC 64411]|uniref:Uncharacterized protein n=1 Tax=Magnaporthiopsis poae (strain ATCC 64411 / 73-15) TaxID=644358 RepID=A0A0C4DSQ8_MAGP6|nr:hypothetical protein MAPG_02946 [Magnaporthiopsis poae ATCC 64411]
MWPVMADAVFFWTRDTWSWARRQATVKLTLSTCPLQASSTHPLDHDPVSSAQKGLDEPCAV